VKDKGEESPATIYDVAQAAGVNPSTVSRAFSRPGRVSARTAQLIQRVADELGYRRQEVVPVHRPSATKILGLSVADVTNPFNFRLIRGCQTAAASAGFVMILSDSQESEELERDLLRRQLPLVDGMVIASSRLSDKELRGVARQVPTVVLNRRLSGVTSIVPDALSGVRQAVDHLVSLGHDHICYLAGPEASWADGARWSAVRDLARERRLIEHRVGPNHPTIKGGRIAAQTVRSRGYSAVIAYNDVMAIGVVKGLVERGLSVPGDVSIIGFDNIFASELVTPGLTTVASPLTAIGEAAVRHLVGELGGPKPSEPFLASMPMKLIVRESTGPAPR
jgi:LacI family transcriptional regulator